jgi:hypothetical protein
MVGNDANLDILQLALRITSTSEVSTILAKHPEWDKSPRRLRLPTVSKNMGVFSNSVDHTGPRAYLCPDKLRPSTFTLATSWKRGRRLLEDKYPWIIPILQSISSTENASILAPYGTNLVTNSHTGGVGDTITSMEEDIPSHQSDGSMCTPEVPDATIGMQELEDAVVENGWRNSEAYGKGTSNFSHLVQIEGKAVNKSRAIAQQFRYVTSASSTDRLRRVAQESRFKTTSGLGVPHSQAGDAHIDRPALSVLQPIATVILCEDKLFLCLAEVNGLFLDHQAVDDIPISVLSEKIAQVSYQGLRLVPASYSDDRDGKHDWRSFDLFRLCAKVPGALVLPINPDVASHNPCDAFFLFQTSELMAFAASLRDSILGSHRKAIPQFKPSDYFPYQEQNGKSSLPVSKYQSINLYRLSGKACFLLEHADPDSGLIDHIGLTCPNCRPIINFNPSLRQRIVEHISAHVLHDPSVNRLSEPCGLCLRPAPLCKIVLKRAKGQTGYAINMKASSCPNLVKFSITIAAECSDSSPCTNRPIICPHCDVSESSRVVWSYNFRSHLLHKHPRISSQDHGNILTLTKLEKDGMRRVWEHRLKQPKVRRKSQRAPLVISEMHRSRLVLKYVLLFYFIKDTL